MLSCFKRSRSARFLLEPPTSASSTTAHKCSASSKERNYFNEMNKDPCSLIEEVKTHFNMADTKYEDFSSEEKISIKSIDSMKIHGPQHAKEEDFAHPSNIALIQQLDCYREEKEQHVVSTFVSKNGTICSAEDRKNGTICSAKDRKNGNIHITEAISSMNTLMKEIFCSEEEKEKNLISSSIEDDSIEDKELDSKEADKDTLSGNLVSGPVMLEESGILENKPTVEAIFDSFADGKEHLKKAIPEEGITCVMRRVCDTDNHQDPESDYDEINMSDEASCSIVEDGEEEKGAINVAHKDYNEYYKKGVITSPSIVEPGARLFSYGISDQQRDFLFLCAGLVIQAVGFQLRSLVEVVTALILLCYRIYIFMCRITDTISRAKQTLAERRTMLLSYVAIDKTRIAQQMERWESMKPLLIQGAKKMGWGCLTAAYVIAMLCALLLTSFLFSYILAVKGPGTASTQKPIHIRRELYFDYTKAHPETSLDLFSLDAYSRMSNATKGTKVNPGAGRLRYRCTILLTLPESDHNRKLGVFQVRSEVVSEKGEIMGKGSQPCMLLFKSNTLHYVKSMVMAIPLLTGLASEAQTLSLQLLEWHHVADTSATARFLQIVLVPRAGSTGLPQLYKAHLLLHSLHSPSSSLPYTSSRTLKTLFMWILLSFLIFGCLSTFCMYRMHHNKI